MALGGSLPCKPFFQAASAEAVQTVEQRQRPVEDVGADLSQTVSPFSAAPSPDCSMSLTEHDNSFSRSKSRPPSLDPSVISTALASFSILSNLLTTLDVGPHLYLFCRPVPATLPIMLMTSGFTRKLSWNLTCASRHSSLSCSSPVIFSHSLPLCFRPSSSFRDCIHPWFGVSHVAGSPNTRPTRLVSQTPVPSYCEQGRDFAIIIFSRPRPPYRYIMLCLLAFAVSRKVQTTQTPAPTFLP
jgi:hypothetical protein